MNRFGFAIEIPGGHDHIGLCRNVFDDGQIIYRMFLRIDAETHKVQVAAVKLITI